MAPHRCEGLDDLLGIGAAQTFLNISRTNIVLYLSESLNVSPSQIWWKNVFRSLYAGNPIFYDYY